MTWTFTDSPETVPRDALRVAIGDTKESDPQLSDAQISYYLNKNSGNVTKAAIEACEALAAKYSRDAAEYVGDLNNPPALKADNYRKLARLYRDQLRSEGVAQKPRKAGVSSEALNRTPAFKRGMCQ